MPLNPMRLIPLAGLLALALTGTAPAQETKVESSARIDAVSYQPIPPGAQLETQPETQSQMDDEAWRQVSGSASTL